MDINNNFDWPQREKICKSQLQLIHSHPSGTLIDGMPIELYWEEQLRIAKTKNYNTSFDNTLDELSILTDKHIAIINKNYGTETRKTS